MKQLSQSEVFANVSAHSRVLVIGVAEVSTLDFSMTPAASLWSRSWFTSLQEDSDLLRLAQMQWRSSPFESNGRKRQESFYLGIGRCSMISSIRDLMLLKKNSSSLEGEKPEFRIAELVAGAISIGTGGWLGAKKEA